MRPNEQKLVDIMFEIAFAVRDSTVLQRADNPELAGWVRHQLEVCGFPTKPVGSSWGMLAKPRDAG